MGIYSCYYTRCNATSRFVPFLTMTSITLLCPICLVNSNPLIFDRITLYCKLRHFDTPILKLNFVLFQKFLAKPGWKEGGDVTLSEFIHYVREHEKNLRLQFSHLDKNQDGKYHME